MSIITPSFLVLTRVGIGEGGGGAFQIVQSYSAKDHWWGVNTRMLIWFILFLSGVSIYFWAFFAFRVIAGGPETPEGTCSHVLCLLILMNKLLVP